jgi:LysR family glycine cleavage system transcriptional activator
MVLINSALRGEGIALCGRRLAEDFISQGDLVRPIPVAQESDRGFWLLRPRDGQLSEQARLFYNWLLDEARKPS